MENSESPKGMSSEPLDDINPKLTLEGIHRVARLPVERHKHKAGQGQTQMLRRVNDALTKSLDKANELIEMIQHFNDVADRKKEEQKESSHVVFDELVRQVLNSLQRTFPIKNMTMLKIIPEDLPPVCISREHLETILFNLLHFIRYIVGNKAGIMTIEGNLATDREKYGGSGAYHDLRVSYSSPSVSANLDSCFDPFKEGNEYDRSSKFGLFVAKKLVEHKGGQIRIETSEKSSTFIIEIPA